MYGIFTYLGVVWGAQWGGSPMAVPWSPWSWELLRSSRFDNSHGLIGGCSARKTSTFGFRVVRLTTRSTREAAWESHRAAVTCLHMEDYTSSVHGKWTMLPIWTEIPERTVDAIHFHVMCLSEHSQIVRLLLSIKHVLPAASETYEIVGS